MSSQSLDGLKKRISEVINYAKMIPGVPTGIYLTADEIELLHDELSDENRIERSVGRYRYIPVYEIESIELGEDECREEYEGIVFTYVPMLSVF